MSVLDDFDQAAAATPPAQSTQPASLLQAFDQTASAASAPPPPPAKPATRMDSFETGLGDLGVKAAQLINRVVPDSALNKVNDLNKWVSDKTGAQYMRWQDIDAAATQREQDYQASRQAAQGEGQPGFDWYRLAGNIANPVNYIPGARASTTLGRVALGGLQGAASSVLSTPTTGDDAKNFWQSQAKLGVLGALGGAGTTLAMEAVSPLVSKGATALRNFVKTGGQDVSPQADQIVQEALQTKGIDPQSVSPDMLSWFKGQVQSSLQAGIPPNKVAVANLAEAASLPVPVPLLRGQAERDSMKYTMEQNLRGVQGIGEPITDVLVQQNKALIANMDAMGAKNAPNVVDAGQVAIDTLKKIDDQAKGSVTAAYQAFRNATGKDLDVPLQGLAQDYARVKGDFEDAIPSAIRNKFESLGLLSGSQNKTFSITDAENLIKTINQHYDPSNRAQANALDQLRKSVQGAITDGAGTDAVGSEAAQLAQRARQLAAARFNMIDSVPAYKAAVIQEAAPDKFLQKYFWNGNAGDVSRLKSMLAVDPNALASVKSAVMGDLKQTALNNQSPENGVFSQAKFNGVIRDQNNAKRLQALFEPQEVQRLNSLGNVAEIAMVPPKASAVNTSNTASAAANLIQGAAKGGVGTKALTQLGGMDIPIVSWAARQGANKSSSSALANLVRQSTQPLAAADIDALNVLTKKSGTIGGLLAGNTQK